MVLIMLYHIYLEKKFSLKKTSALVLLFILGSFLTSVYNLDIKILASSIILAVPIIAMNEGIYNLKIELINTLFLLTIVIGIVTYHLGVNVYGYLPSHSFINGERPWWRVAIFPTSTPTISGFFSLFVYIVNIKRKSIPSNIVKVLAIYFLLFSGSRSVILLFIGIIIYRLSEYYSIKSVKHVLPYFLLIVPIVVLTTTMIFNISSSEIGQEFLLRGENYNSEGDLDSYARFILWNNLLEIFQMNPIIGVGSFDLYEFFPFSPSHSEAKWLTLLASNGLITATLVWFCIIKYHFSLGHNLYVALGVMVLVIGMFYYGSFYNAYNFIYLINLYLIGGNIGKK